MKKILALPFIALLITGATCRARRDPEGARYILKPAAGPSPMAVAVSCTGGDNLPCDTAAGQSACTVSQGCSDGECKFAVASGPDCPCYEGDIRWCGSGTSDVQFCAEVSPGRTAWQAECGPTQVACTTAYPSNPTCASGTVATVFDTTKAQWIPDPGAICAPGVGCPADGHSAACRTDDPRCPDGLRAFSRATGWGPCTKLNCPSEPLPVCPAGATESCVEGGCGGTRTCLGGQAWSDCRAPRPCPDGWSWDGSSCTWTSPNQPSFVKYYPHRSENDKVAASGAIGYPAPGGQPGPVYVEATLEQWSNPPAAGGGNYCGNNDFVSAWVGCIHPNNSRGYGRDVRDREWQENVTIPLRCDPGDLVGVYKHSWGHLAFWHCTRQLSLRVIRNHDGISACRW